MGLRAAKTYWIFPFVCVCFNIFISSVTGQTNIPQWVNPPDSIFQREGTPIGTTIGSLRLENGHGLMITSENKFVNVTETDQGPGYVVVDIILNTKLDYDSGVTQITCFFKGVNDDVPAGTQVQIPLYVTNVNDETPSLENQPYSVYVPENMTAGAVIYNIISKDRDSDDSLTFTITTAVDEYKGKFIINNTTGQIILTGQLDFESVRFYQYTVTVTDEVGHNNGAEIFITIQDVQDTPPYFTGEPFQTNIWENEPLNTSVFKVVASDGDKGVSNGLTFIIINATCKDLFQIEPSSGVVSLKASADRDKGDVYSNSGICTLGVQATEDNQYPQASGSIWIATTFVTITILDINDNGPKFSSTTYNVTVDENTQQGVPINLGMPINAYDSDQGNNARFNVSITKLREYFEVTPSQVQSSGEILIRVKNSTILDYEKNHTLILELEARDAFGSSTATVTINIQNVNDNSPTFTNSTYVGYVQERSASGTSILTLTATDDDENDGIHYYHLVTYSLEGSDTSFKINSSTGEVMVGTADLDRETKSVYYVTVVAKDGGNSKVSTVLEIRVSDINDETPKFVTSDYQTSLNENSMIFSRPIIVYATDNDEPNTLNSAVTYTILSAIPNGLKSNFNITTNGSLSVTSAVDYEKIFHPGGDGKITLTVQAEDQGQPALSSNVSVIIFLQDINDENPQCNQSLYETLVPENSNKSTKVTKIWATDVDGTEPNNLIMYSIDQENAGKFIIDSRTGWLSLRDKVDREERDSYIINITITDLGVPARSGSCQVSVNVTDINDSPPVFVQKQMTVNLEENKAGQSFNITVKDDDLNPKLVYEIIWHECTATSPSGQKVNASVLQDWLTINNRTGIITTTDKLDRETIESFTLAVEVEDANSQTGRQVDNMNITILVEDVNDNGPEFSSTSYEGTIQEGMPVDSQVLISGSVTVTDKDKGSYSKFTLGLNNYGDVFKIIPEEGEGQVLFALSVKNSTFLDYEHIQHLLVEVVATEKTTENKHSSTAMVNISIININDNMPEFTGAPFNGSVYENEPASSSVTVIQAKDSDLGEFGILTFSLLNNPSKFWINSSTGEVFTTEKLDREEQETYTLSVKASDKGNFASTTQLIITVMDDNDNSPQFIMKEISRSMVENAIIFAPPLLVQATDKDVGNNGLVEYSLVSSEPPHVFHNFTIDNSTSEITLNSELDYETLFNLSQGVITLNVQAKDHGHNPMNATISVNITVTDYNDMAPVFIHPNNTVQIPENFTQEGMIFQVSAVDGDVGEDNHRVHYRIDTLSASTFAINETTGQLTLKTGLDYEALEYYDIIITAFDHGTPVQTSTFVMHVDVTDVNDDIPQFDKKQEAASSVENRNISYTCSAQDKDTQHELVYSIDWSKSSGRDGVGTVVSMNVLKTWVDINYTTGEVKSLRELDREQISEFTLQINVTDVKAEEKKPQTDTVTLTITVEDENDEPPIFTKGNNYTASIQENMPAGSDIKFENHAALEIFDADEGANSNYNVMLLTYSTIFSINPSSGTSKESFIISVLNSSALDYEEITNFTLEILAMDANNANLNSSATITVNIINENDNVPEFTDTPYHTSLLENSTANSHVFQVKAEDKDSGIFGTMEYVLEDKYNTFCINITSGEVILLHNNLDRENISEYTVTLTVKDKGNFKATTQLTITIIDVNDHPPKFSENEYILTFDEESNSILPMFYVQATDKDDPSSPNSKVEYSLLNSLVAPYSYFSVGPESGMLNLSSRIDCEATYQACNGYLILKVQAEDQGMPHFSDNATIKITVKDINDNSPAFVPSNYTATVYENALTDTIVTTVSAFDKDVSAPNNIVSYMLDTFSNKTFSINDTGTISVKGKLDRELNSHYTIIVTALDHGKPQNTGTALVIVDVADENDSPPTFSWDSKSVSIRENTKGPITENIATDLDQNPSLFYSFMWPVSSGMDGAGRYIPGSSLESYITINESTGEVSPIGELDREKVQRFQLTLLVEDRNAKNGAKQNDTAILTVVIEDVNDNPPTFIGGNNFTATIQENMPKDSTIKMINISALIISDADSGNNSMYDITLEDTSVFTISPSQGNGNTTCVISVVDPAALDYETHQNFTLTVIARELMTEELLNSSATVTVLIENINDNFPKFDSSSYEASVLENSATGTLITSLTAVDDDFGEFGKVHYFTDGTQTWFTIDNETGHVKVNTSLNREERNSYTITVKARDIKNFEGTTQLTVTVADENDETPEFVESYQAEVKEKGKSFKVPLIVKATDNDEPESNNSRVFYSITKIPSQFSKGSLHIDNITGEITMLSKAPDYEDLLTQNIQHGFLQLEVTATDGGVPPRNSTVVVNVTVTDDNDEDPYFTETIYYGRVFENSPEGTSVAKVTADDQDGTSPNKDLYYAIQSGSHDKFQINSSTGVITVGVGAKLDRETTDKDGFKLTVLAIDKGSPPRTGATTVNVTIMDVNDSPPEITPTNIVFPVYENTSDEIADFNATDSDVNADLSFSILWTESHAYDEKEKEANQSLIQDWLHIDNVSGTVTVKSEMDRERVEQIVLKVMVTDKNAASNFSPQQATATVTVSLLDVNDNPPVISTTGRELSLDVSEGMKINAEVTTLTATDADKRQTVKFSLEDTNSNFSITDSGKLTLVGKLDRESQANLSFTVIATDSGSPAMSSNITVNINVLDINDNDPEFLGNNFIFTVQENSATMTIIARMNATDADDGDNGIVTFEFMDNSPFRIESNTGDIYVSGDLDRETTPSYTLTVIAADNPVLESRRRASTPIKIVLTDVNDNSPSFSRSAYTGTVSEITEVGLPVSILPSPISATDIDEGNNAHITFSLLDSSDFIIEPLTGNVKVNVSLIGKPGEYSYIVNATDGGSPALWAAVNLTIKILDENVNDPVFVQKGPIDPIAECAGHSKFVYTFLATDADKDTTTNAKVQYYLFDGASTNDSQLFYLNPDSGVLSTIGGDNHISLFNHESRPELVIEVMAQDNGVPPRSSQKIPLHIQIIDINDNPPEFHPTIKTVFHVQEEDKNSKVGSVKADDKDENTILVYEISDADKGWKDYFYIITDPNEGGIIYVNKTLDREVVEKIVIKVTAIDRTQSIQYIMCDDVPRLADDRSQPLEVTVLIDDINDSPPVFKKKSHSFGFLSSTEFGKTLITLPTFVQDNDTALNSVHQFYQVSEVEPDKDLSRTWSSAIKPIKVDLNGTLSTNYKFSEDSYGFFTVKVLVNDSAGSDTINLKIYVVGKSQVIHLTLWQTEDNLRQIQDDIIKGLSKTGYTFFADNILPANKDDGTVDNSKSVLVTHAVDDYGNIVTGKRLINIIDESDVVKDVQNKYKISKTESGEEVGKQAAENSEERMQFILIGIIAVIAATFVITLGLLLHNIQRFKRKLKAATIEVHGFDQMKQDSFPGLDNSAIKSANPLFMRNDLALDEGIFGNNDYGTGSEDSLSQKSQNSLDKNALTSDFRVKAKPALDEQEVTLDMYGNDDVGPHSSGIYSDTDLGNPESLQDDMNSTSNENKWRPNKVDSDDDVHQTLDLSNFEFTEI